MRRWRLAPGGGFLSASPRTPAPVPPPSPAASPLLPRAMDMVSSMWRSLTQSAGSSSSSTAAAIDAASARRLLESIQLAMFRAYQARHQRGERDAFRRALSVEEIAPIKALCDQLTPAHFRLKVPEPVASSPRRRGTGRNRVRYQHIWENDMFSMGIFILPPGSSIPLHDHPEMSVISRVLYGGLHVTSCDIVPADELHDAQGKEQQQEQQQHHQRLSPESPATTNSSVSSSVGSPETLASGRTHMARIFTDATITAPHTTELLPDRGNLHEFVADDALGCAIFDILTPPYEPDEGRDCTYYRIIGDPLTAADGRAYVELEEFTPVDFDVKSEPYLGPRLTYPVL